MLKILVTGGTGFVGTNLCQQLLTAGHKVIALDNFFSSSRDNLKALEAYENFQFIEHDVVNPIQITDDIDQVYHLACPASPVYYQADHIYTLKTCFLGSMNVLNLAKEKQARVLFTSTSEIYGDPKVHPQPESYFGNVNSLGPRSCYDEGKRVAESLFVNYHLAQGVDIRIVRIFNTYGPYMNAADGRVVSNFIMAAFNNEPLLMHNDGEQTRSFCYVSDLIQGLTKVMSSAQYTGPINLGNPSEITIKELAETLLNKMASASTLQNKPARIDDPVRRRPDISKAKQELNWQPAILLDEGLTETIAYFQGLQTA